ncbi:MAG: hypothetical protein GQ570_11620 [Helicobacteraceae bacterium]|nr:hypothetical protein [Helicobacteraceae bacterium]
MDNMTPLQNAVIASSMIGSLLSNYSDEDKKKYPPIGRMDKHINKFLKNSARLHLDKYVEAVNLADTAWRSAVNYFADKSYSIEAISTIIQIQYLFEKPLLKNAKLTSKMFEELATFESDLTTVDLARDSKIIVDYIIDKMPQTGIKKKESKLKTMRLNIKNNMIIERG